MKLRSLKLTNFKNIPEACLGFSPKVNCFLGDNGMGKSNLLDAIYFLSFSKSYSRVPDAMLIRRGETFGIVSGQYDRNGADEEITAGLRQGVRKSFKRGGKEYKRLSAHIGLFPAVMVAPADLDLVTGASDERRRFIDMIISQGDPVYMDALIRYGQALEQRNRMLRDEIDDKTLYESIEMVMEASADIIHSRRRESISRLAKVFDNYYRRIAGEGEVVGLTYSQSVGEGESFMQALERVRSRDRMLHYTTFGPHRDDIDFVLNDMPVRRTASQGQCKTFTIALRLAQYEFLRELVPVAPLLLLDDIFDKLDARRVERIISLVANDDFGQIFITDTNRKHLDEIIAAIGSDYCIWSVADGVFNPIAVHEKD